MRSPTTVPSRAPLAMAAVSGLILFLLGLITPPDGPEIGHATADDVRSFVAANDVALRLAATTGVVAVIALLAFTVACSALVRADRSASLTAGLVGAGGVVLAVVQLLTVGVATLPRLLPGLVDTSLAAVPDETVRTWGDLVGLTHFLGDLQMALVALVVLATAIAVLRRRVLPVWLGWVGLVIGSAAALGTLAITAAVEPLYAAWFVGLFGGWLWWLLVAIGAGVRLGRRHTAAGGEAPREATATVPRARDTADGALGRPE